MKQFKNILRHTSILVIILGVLSCDKYEPLGEGSIPDATPPQADFSYAQGAGTEEEWKDYIFANSSTSATMFVWDFGDGNTSTETDPSNTYPGEGDYKVSLTASDALGVVSVSEQTISVVEPEEPDVPDPALVNADFNKLAKSSGSDCSCAGWINKKVGDQGESSSGNGGSDNVLKFDNNEPDHIYQEFEVVPNADYTMQVVTSFKSPEGGMYPSMLELRVLAGTGYTDGYAPAYYTDTVSMPQEGWGYDSVAQIEEAANNLLVEVQDNPNDDGYITYTYSFNAGPNNSVALFARGIGGPATGGGGGDFGYNSGDEEIRIDTVTITAIND